MVQVAHVAAAPAAGILRGGVTRGDRLSSLVVQAVEPAPFELPVDIDPDREWFRTEQQRDLVLTSSAQEDPAGVIGLLRAGAAASSCSTPPRFAATAVTHRAEVHDAGGMSWSWPS